MDLLMILTKKEVKTINNSLSFHKDTYPYMLRTRFLQHKNTHSCTLITRL